MAPHDPASSDARATLATRAARATPVAATAGGDPAAPDRADDATLNDLWSALQRGAGRERVHDGNVAALIRRARAERDAQLEVLLREWRSPCGDDPDAPSLPPALPPAAPGERPP